MNGLMKHIKTIKNLCVSEEDTVYSMKDFILRIRDDEEFAKNMAI